MARLFGEYKITLLDESWDFKPDDLTVGELVVIEREFGDTFDEMCSQVNDFRPEACQVLVWFLRGRKQERITVDIKPRRLEMEMTVDPKGKPVVREEPATTEMTTSEPSPTTSGSTPTS